MGGSLESRPMATDSCLLAIPLDDPEQCPEGEKPRVVMMAWEDVVYVLKTWLMIRDIFQAVHGEPMDPAELVAWAEDFLEIGPDREGGEECASS